MTRSSNKRRLLDLASAVVDGTCNEAQRRELNEILRSDETARDEYLAFLDLHAVLTTELSVETMAEEDSHEVAPSIHPSPKPRWVPITAVLALAASLLIAVSPEAQERGNQP